MGSVDDAFDVTLRRGDMGFGFRVVGGKEEQTQVTLCYDDFQVNKKIPESPQTDSV